MTTITNQMQPHRTALNKTSGRLNQVKKLLARSTLHAAMANVPLYSVAGVKKAL